MIVSARYVAAGVTLAVVAVVAVRSEHRDRAAHAEILALTGEVHELRATIAARGAEPPALAAFPEPRACTIDGPSLQAVTAAVIAALGASSRAATPAARDAEPPPPRSIAQEESAARPRAILDDALRRGHLARADVVAMREAMQTTSPTPDERDALMAAIARAINDQKLAPEDPHFIYP